jgi:hypothetical protein
MVGFGSVLIVGRHIRRDLRGGRGDEGESLSHIIDQTN